MRVLVTGAGGFIGSAIVEALLRNGHEVVACVRSHDNLPVSPMLRVAPIKRFEALRTEDWLVLLQGVTAVVNAAGILRERRAGDFERVHVAAPMALAQGCRSISGIKLIQISALGTHADGPFITSKQRFDEAVLALDMPVTVIRPSVVLSTRGSYGGTSLLRALAATPAVVLLPGDGLQRMQPVLLEDLAELVVRCLPATVANGHILHAVGPEVITIREYLALVRSWLRLTEPRWVRVPESWVALAVWIGEKAGVGPLGSTIAGMLERGNVAPAHAHAQTLAETGLTMRPVTHELQHAASFVQDRWHARMYLLRPLLWVLLAAVWVMSGISGLLATPESYASILDAIGVPGALQSTLVITTSVLDIVLALALITRWRPRLVLGLMLASVLAYSTINGVLAPALWLDPLGGLLKNLALIGMLLVLMVVEDSR